MDTKLRGKAFFIVFKILAFILIFISLMQITISGIGVKDIEIYLNYENENYYINSDTKRDKMLSVLYSQYIDEQANYDLEIEEFTKLGYKYFITDEAGKVIKTNETTDIICKTKEDIYKRYDNVIDSVNISEDGTKEPQTTYVTLYDNFFEINKERFKDNAKQGSLLFSLGIGAIILFITGIILCIYIENKRSKINIKLNIFNKILIDILLVLFILICIGLITAVVLLGLWLIEASNINKSAILVLIVISNALLTSNVYLFVTSLVKRANLKGFFKYTLIYKIGFLIFKFLRKIFIFFTLPIKKFANKTLFNKLIVTTAVIYVIVLINALFCLIVTTNPYMIPFMFLWAILFNGLIIFTCVKYLMKKICDLKEIEEGVIKIREGNLKHKIATFNNTELNTLATNVNNIGDGLENMIKAVTKSENMKTELISNVSHDLKTPLTSIIGYVDLLSKEQNLTPQAYEYIDVLQLKSQRLSSIISDLFDLSKSSSGNAEVDIEKIDIVKLLLQTIGDMEDKILASDSIIKENIPQEDIYIYADGKRMYRVFQNLIDNALKYSLQGTRIFISINRDDKTVTATIQNVSMYEIDYTKEDILERFVRGDASRTTDGAGLGLSIAKNFTNLCGGKLNVNIDGDQFKVNVTFDLAL